MKHLDEIDLKLLEILRLNARASVTVLAGELGLARATVKTRMEQLTASGVIRRFTIEIEPGREPELIRAVILLELDGAKERSVIRQLRKIAAITSLHTTNGRWGLIGHFETRSLPEFDQTIRAIQSINGVVNSESCLMLDDAPY